MAGPGMSGPTGPGTGDGDADADADELPWPPPEPEADGAADNRVHDEADGASPESGTRSERRAAHAAVVRRRRRVLAVVAGGLLVLVLAFALWYELESHAFGPEGPQVVVTVHEGESTSSVVSSLSAHNVIGSSLAFQISDIFHGTPTVLPGSYALHQNLTFAEARTILAAGPNIYPVDVRPGFTLHEVAVQVGSINGHSASGFEATASSGAVHSVFSPPGSNNLEGMLGTGTYNVLPGESNLTIVQHMVAQF